MHLSSRFRLVRNCPVLSSIKEFVTFQKNTRNLGHTLKQDENVNVSKDIIIGHGPYSSMNKYLYSLQIVGS